MSCACYEEVFFWRLGTQFDDSCSCEDMAVILVILKKTINNRSLAQSKKAWPLVNS